MLDPQFIRGIEVNYRFEKHQRYRVNVYHAKNDKELSDLSKQHFIGRADFTVSELVNEVKMQLEVPLMDSNDNELEEIQMTLCCEKVKMITNQMSIGFDIKADFSNLKQ